MVRSVRTTAIFTFFSIFLLFITVTPVFAGGGKDADLARADALINEREYDEAMSILTDFARRNPDKFDLANQRLRRIYRIREEVKRTADELIETLTNEPGNNEKILELSRRLHSLENANSSLLVNFVSRTQEIAQFNFNRNLLRDILERGRRFLDAGDCTSAIQAYAEGMSLMRTEFFASNYGANIENQVTRETARINSTVASFQQLSSQMGTISAELVRAINAGETSRINEITNRLTPTMDRFIESKQVLYSAANTLDRLLNEIWAAHPEITGEQNHLSFISTLIHGRTDEAIHEGMLGAFDTYWTNSIGSVVNEITRYVVRANASSLSSFNSGDYADAVSSLNSIGISFSPLYFDRHRQLFAGARPQTISLFGNTILNEDIPSYLEIRALYESNNFLLQAGSTITRQNIDRSSITRWQQGSITIAQALTAEQQTRNNINTMQRSIETIRINAVQLNTEISLYYNTPHVANAISAIEKLSSNLFAESNLAAQRYYNIVLQNYQNNLAVRKDELARARGFLDGQRRTNTDGSVVISRYPAEALELLTSMTSALRADLQNGNSTLQQFRNEPAGISDNRELLNITSNYQTVLNEMTTINTQATSLVETARTRSAQAETFRQEGERLYREAQTAYQRQNFDLARERIQRSSDVLTQSLDIQESASLRQIRDVQLINLGQSITASEYEAIIVEVRNLVNNARNAYFNGNFQQAEDGLLRARSRWSITGQGDNEEIVYWLGMIRSAMSVSTGRVISPNAPLYAEMSQLLNYAQRNFEEGVRYINSGQRTLGIAKFDEARQLTREVKLLFPVNQQAGILELRMEQVTDPTAFNAAFEQRIRAAIAGTRQRSIEAFADLQNLAEINPRYPNLRAILEQAEIDMGRRQAPPNPANIARSRELTASANRILQSNTAAQYEVALAQLNEAITLNPTNTEASAVRDRLLSRMGVPGSIVLSSEDEANYQRAMNELQTGNNLAALAIVERLMQNPRNRNITKLIELQRRIQSVL